MEVIDPPTLPKLCYFSIGKHQFSIYFAIWSKKEIPLGLQSLGRYLRTRRDSSQPTARIIPIDPISDAWLTILQTNSDPTNGLNFAEGHIYAKDKMTRRWPMQLDLGEERIFFGVPSHLEFKLHKFIYTFKIFCISAVGEVTEWSPIQPEMRPSPLQRAKAEPIPEILSKREENSTSELPRQANFLQQTRQIVKFKSEFKTQTEMKTETCLNLPSENKKNLLNDMSSSERARFADLRATTISDSEEMRELKAALADRGQQVVELQNTFQQKTEEINYLSRAFLSVQQKLDEVSAQLLQIQTQNQSPFLGGLQFQSEIDEKRNRKKESKNMEIEKLEPIDVENFNVMDESRKTGFHAPEYSWEEKLKCLDVGAELNSEVINTFLSLSYKDNKLYTSDIWIYDSSQWQNIEKGTASLNPVKFKNKKYLLFPMNFQVPSKQGKKKRHWAFIVVCNRLQNSNSTAEIIWDLDSTLEVFYIDSLNDDFGYSEKIATLINSLQNCLVVQRDKDLNSKIPQNTVSSLKYQSKKLDVSRQHDSKSCGVFMLYYIDRFMKEREHFLKNECQIEFGLDFKSAPDLDQKWRRIIKDKLIQWSPQTGKKNRIPN